VDTIARDNSSLPANVLDPNCPSRVIFQRIGDKWASLVVQVLEGGPVRFSDLRKMVSVVTPKGALKHSASVASKTRFTSSRRPRRSTPSSKP